MRCGSCDYALWGLSGRTCPECGQGFELRAYTFAPGSVEFCCPHCGDARRSTGKRSFPWPREFTCDKCGQWIGLEQMVVQPAPGYSEDDTRRRDILRWFERPWWSLRGWWEVGQCATVVGEDFTQRMPRQVRWAKASVFMICMIGLLVFGITATYTLPIAIGDGFDDSLVVEAALVACASFVLAIAFIVLMACVVHSVLMLTGRVRGSFGRTFEMVVYTSTPMLIVMLPCMGWILAPFAFAIWMISISDKLIYAHKVSLRRALLAAWSMPLCAAVAFVWWYGKL